MASPETRHLTILLTDIKGFTDKTSHRTRADIQAMLDEHRAIVLPLLEGRGGRLIKTIGDAFLMTFESPTNAVLAGVRVQEALVKRNEGRVGDDRLEIRIAINSGEVNLAEGDVFGEPVNITARIEGIAEAGQVYFTEAVYLAMNKAEVPSAEVGLMQLKGIPEKIRVYKVRREEPVEAVSRAERPRFFGLFPPPKGAAAPATFGPGVKAVPAASMAVPPLWRRFAALCIDGAICSVLAGVFLGNARAPGHARAAERRARQAALEAAAPAIAAGDSARAAKAAREAAAAAVKAAAEDAGRDDAALGSRSGGGELWDGIMSGKWVFAVVWALYQMLFLKWSGASPGKLAMKLRVISLDGQAPDKRQRQLRAVFSLVSGYAAGLGYVWALFEPQRRGWHDLVAGTRVVPAE